MRGSGPVPRSGTSLVGRRVAELTRHGLRVVLGHLYLLAQEWKPDGLPTGLGGNLRRYGDREICGCLARRARAQPRCAPSTSRVERGCARSAASLVAGTRSSASHAVVVHSAYEGDGGRRVADTPDLARARAASREPVLGAYGSAPASSSPPPLTASWFRQAQQAAGNQAVATVIQRADAPAAPPSGAGPPALTSPRRPILDRHVLTMMEEDVDEVRDALTGKWISDEDEARALRRVQKWAARDESCRASTGYGGTDHLDKFLFLLKTRTVPVSGVRTAWVEQTTNVFDLYFDELDGARLLEFKRLVTSSRTQAAEGRTSERSESAWSFVGKREALGVMGMVKGLSTSAAGLADLGAWALGADVSGGGLAGEVGKGWDEMGAAAAGAMGVDINEEAVLGQSSFAVGDIGGKVVGALTTAGALSGASVASQAGVAAVQTAKGIDDLGIALRKLRQGPPPLSWGEISRRPDIWAKVVGVVASATGMVATANAGMPP